MLLSSCIGSVFSHSKFSDFVENGCSYPSCLSLDFVLLLCASSRYYWMTLDTKCYQFVTCQSRFKVYFGDFR